VRFDAIPQSLGPYDRPTLKFSLEDNRYGERKLARLAVYFSAGELELRYGFDRFLIQARIREC
jgi:hypothetical protein